MRSKFDEQLALLNSELIRMGAQCEEAISLAAKALTEGDRTLAEQVRPLEEEIDQMERDIETLCLKLLLQQQPVARDLRQISAAMKIITDMERIGDQAADIAEIVLAMLSEGYVPEDVGHIREMAAETIKMVTESVDTYVRQDSVRAGLVIAHDDIIDSYFTQVKKVLIQKIVEQPDQGEHILDLLMIDKYLERIGDHAVNIAEWVIFSVNGVQKGE
ncbi:MAG: phosphate signaling complex protein PhoU [Lachnospiraceae bacterium]|nr:phosphate signaling complex protein PhoU [Lachnospiraceae bacterium]MCM1215622.1 phosphate signaling complex protein PhoU [Lachnospiraceae bacterium]